MAEVIARLEIKSCRASIDSQNVLRIWLSAISTSNNLIADATEEAKKLSEWQKS